MKDREKALSRLDDERRKVEDKLGALRSSLDREFGTWVPTKGRWAVPLVGFACGLAVAVLIGRRKGG